MDERIFARLAALLESEAVVLASVLATRGATPRKRGSRMLVTRGHEQFSVGGGEAEARVVGAARSLLGRGDASVEVRIDLSGGAGAAGVCGGTMQLGLRRWAGLGDQARARAIAERLASGEHEELSPDELGGDDEPQRLLPDARLLIVGGGHCALALAELARHVDFDIRIHDPHAAEGGDPSPQLASALATRREVYAVLLNRDFHSDVAALSVLRAHAPVFIGMMGSRRRIAEVGRALGDDGSLAKSLHAPVGLEIDAQTPHEIAVSILAQLIAERRKRNL